MKDRWLANARLTRAIEIASPRPAPGGICDGLRDLVLRARVAQENLLRESGGIVV
jgi:hypothetical protein